MLKKRWNTKKEIAILLCGSAEKEVDIVFNEFLLLSRVHKSFPKKSEPIVTTALPSRVALFEGLYEKSHWDPGKGEAFSLLKIGQPRKWFRSYRGSKFSWLHLWFVFRVSDFLSEEKKQLIYREFHGTLGEAKESNQTMVAVTLFMDTKTVPVSFSMTDILNFLKISPVKIKEDAFNCPFYAGPVTILINVFFESTEMYVHWFSQPGGFVIEESDFSDDNERLRNNVGTTFHWLFCQPSYRPHFSARGGCSMLGRLLEQQTLWENNEIFWKQTWRNGF